MNTTKYNILIIIKDVNSKHLIKTLLSNTIFCQFNIFETTEFRTSLRISGDKPIDAIVLDYTPKDQNVLAQITASDAPLPGPLPPIVALVDNHSEESTIAALKLGVNDYLHKKELSPLRLEKTLLSCIKQHHLEKSSRIKEEALMGIILHDPLTNLPNRRAFEQALKLFLSASERYRRHSALLFLDLDKFKVVNDTFGHMIGDKLLQEVAQRLQAQLRAGDFLSRFGGDEFTILLNEIKKPKDASIIAQRICSTLKQQFMIDNHAIQTGVSIGIACLPSTKNDLRHQMDCADKAMYKVKQTGGNGYRFG